MTAFGQYYVRTLQGDTHHTKINHNDIKKIPEILEDENYEVEKIIKHRKDKQGKYEFYVKRRNYNSRHNSWVREDQFGEGEMIKEYKKRNKIPKDCEGVNSC